MKTITILNAQQAAVHDNYAQNSKMLIAQGSEAMDASDGYHTFTELYEHRITLFIALSRSIVRDWSIEHLERPAVWRSKLHADGTTFDGWFVMGIGKESGKQITYHLPLTRWSDCDFAETLDKAPEWDGHSSKDVLERLKRL